MRAGGPGQKPSPGQLGSPHEVSFYVCLEFVCICLEFVYTCLEFFMFVFMIYNSYLPHEVNNLKQQLADAKSKIDGLEKQLEEKQRHIVELEGKLKV